MGSLMAGWNSPVEDPRVVKLRRNSSLTKEEIDAFWRTKKQREEEHLRDISALSPRSQMHALSTKEEEEEEEEGEKESAKGFMKKQGWWISSSWAFLNEPPVIGEGPKQKYVPQFHVANMASSNTNAQTGVGA